MSKVQIQEKSFDVLLYSNALGKRMDPSFLSQSMSKKLGSIALEFKSLTNTLFFYLLHHTELRDNWLSYLDRITDLGERKKIWIQFLYQFSRVKSITHYFFQNWGNAWVLQLTEKKADKNRLDLYLSVSVAAFSKLPNITMFWVWC